MKALALQLLVAAACCAASIGLYDRLVRRPATAIAVVDAAQLYQGMHTQLMKGVPSAASAGDALRAIERSQQFQRRFQRELFKLAEECQCLLVDKAAVIGMRPQVADLTPLLRQRVQ
ncbi:hypothetical protein [Pseudoduganella violacea]|uniref:Uncharacterized protein n=1 Tax=Pseudoduganella violacea TaxID=1715466 RepID=A0A7W5BFD2_9BURK|nr:hypothetical protein [Pseudoduganella violacea]MBB3122172.1 hypothetical protein [Pseudoduganella violacea]